MLKHRQLKEFLEEKADFYNRLSFIDSDPISIPHLFTRKEDIEIAAFLAATIAWGQRPIIIKNAKRLMAWMDNSPYEFIRSAGKKELTRFQSFKHRTFNGTDAVYFIKALQAIYQQHGGLETCFRIPSSNNPSVQGCIAHFRETFFSLPHPSRTTKHVSNPMEGSAAKRINMFLRWMVRKDKRGVDFGIWNVISYSQLMCPLDVHSGNVSRKLGLLKRQQNDWRAVEELTQQLRTFDANDPVKYDFALFGLGVFEKF